MAIVFAAASSVHESPSYAAAREYALASDQRRHNFVHKACGVGREALSEPYHRIEDIAQRYPKLLIELFSDKNPEVRSTAALMTAYTGNPKYVEPLCRMALRDPDRLARCYAIGALQELEDRRAIPAMHTALSDSSPTSSKEPGQSLKVQGR